MLQVTKLWRKEKKEKTTKMTQKILKCTSSLIMFRLHVWLYVEKSEHTLYLIALFKGPPTRKKCGWTMRTGLFPPQGVQITIHPAYLLTDRCYFSLHTLWIQTLIKGFSLLLRFKIILQSQTWKFVDPIFQRFCIPIKHAMTLSITSYNLSHILS